MRTMSVIAAVVIGVGMIAGSASALTTPRETGRGVIAQDGTGKGAAPRHAKKRHGAPRPKHPAKKHPLRHAA